MSLTFSTAPAETAFSILSEARLRAFPEFAATEAANEDFFRWKFLGRPSHVFLAADASGRTVGGYCAIEHKYLVRGRPVRVAVVVDVFTDPSIRKQGVFTRLGKYSLDGLQAAGCDFAVGYPIRPEVLPGHIKVGWRVAHQLPLYVSPVHGTGLLAAAPPILAKPLEMLGALSARVLTRNLRVDLPQTADLSFVTTEELLGTPGYEAFLSRWAAGKAFILGEGPDFYRWRYGAPRRTFRHLLLRSGSALVGVISTRVMDLRGVQGLAIADLQLLPEASQLIKKAWRFLWRQAWAEKLAVLAVMAPPALASRAAFLTLPFIRTHLHFKLITRDLCSGAPDVALDPDLKLTWTDTDDA